MKIRTALTLLKLVVLIPILAGQTMTFDSGASEPGFSFTNWTGVSGILFQSDLSSPAVIASVTGTFRIVSFQTVNFGSAGDFVATSDLGDSYTFDPNTGGAQTHMLDWNGISTFTITRVDPAGGSYDFDNVVYSATVPVEFVAFGGTANREGIELGWSTASEINNLGFEIQKSSDGKDWALIEYMEGQGTSDVFQEYQFKDFVPYTGNNYYRLKQLDIDGNFEYSNVIAIQYYDANRNLQIFPNPSNGVVNINLANIADQSMRVKISDNLGRMIWHSEVIEGATDWRKELEIEKDGVYFLTVEIGNQIFNERLVIAKGE